MQEAKIPSVELVIYVIAGQHTFPISMEIAVGIQLRT